eukprot:gene1476-biopygen1224
MANYSAHFIKDCATITEPLRQLTRKDAHFARTEAHQEAYNKLKTTLINSPVMTYFDISKETSILVNASPVGLSAILVTPNPPEPLLSTPMPDRPWQDINIDFCGPFPSGHYILVVTDRYSRFPEVEILTSTSAKKVIPKLDTIFARHGLPSTLTSDNGPPFQSEEFKRYLQRLGIKHTPSTPLWPQGNSEDPGRKRSDRAS